MNEVAPAKDVGSPASADSTPLVLIVDADVAIQQACLQIFERRGYRAEALASAAAAVERISQGQKRGSVDLVLCDVNLGREQAGSGLDLLRELKALYADLPVLLLSSFPTVQDAVEAMKLGAADYVTKPFERSELLRRVEVHLGQKRTAEGKVLSPAPDESFAIKGLIGASAPMRKVFDRIAAAARSSATVLITGESGTGKELVARAIHFKSARRDKPFVPVNCAALPDNLIESELFGHEAGSFTGATREAIGLFRAAHCGTILLDEIADMPKDMQAKLLRVLQDHRIRPVGSTKELAVDVRVVTATNLDVSKARLEGKLRDDLFFRISVIRIELPALRDRLDDLPLLVQYFLAKHAKEHRIRRLAPDALNALLSYAWPGNVRELESVIESAYALGQSEELTLNDLPSHIVANFVSPQAQAQPEVLAAQADPISTAPSTANASGPGRLSGALSLNAMEKEALLRALQVAHGNKSKAAQLLGVSRKRLYRMLHDYGLAEGEGVSQA